LIVYNVFFITYGLQKHAAFQTAGFDLGIWDQMGWNTLHGRPFWFTQHGNITNGLGNHVELILVVLVPLYGLYKGPQIMIVVQALLVSVGALPIYWLARDQLRSTAAGLVFAAVFLLYPALEAAVSFDVHSLTIAVPFLSFALWGMYTGRYKLFGVAAILAMSCKEDVSLLIFMMGLYILVVQRQAKLGLLTMIASLLWFVAAVFVIIPNFQPGGNEYIYRYRAWGDHPLEIVANVLSNPGRVLQVATSGDKLLYWIRLTLPVFFTALLAPLILLLVMPLLLINTLGDYAPAYQLDLFHSSAPLAVYVTFASVLGLARLTRLARASFPQVKDGFVTRLLLIMVLGVTIAYQVQFGHTPIGRFFDWPDRTGHHLAAESLLARIPPHAAVAAENNLVPRLSQRQWVFVLPDLSYRDIQADYVVMDMYGNLDRHRSLTNYCHQLDQLLSNPDYGLILAQDGLLLFQAGAPSISSFEPGPLCL
jgi:uncharacterized membrane protein